MVMVVVMMMGMVRILLRFGQGVPLEQGLGCLLRVRGTGDMHRHALACEPLQESRPRTLGDQG
jgi:hypothetical protein